MQMDPGEILRDFNAAENKTKQIQVLADLNVCKPMEIARVLQEQGAELPATWVSRLKRSEETAAVREELKRRKPRQTPAFQPEPETAEPAAWITADVLLQLLARVPSDTPVRLLGNGVATSVNFLEHFDARTGESRFVFELAAETDG